MQVFEGMGLYSVIKLTLILICFLFIFPPKIAPKSSESNRKMRSDAKVNQKGEKQQQASGSSQASLPSYYELATASTIPRPRIDATDRRQIEAQNEDRSHTTKEALDDIKRVHFKEKKKKQQNNSEPYQPKIPLGRSVS